MENEDYIETIKAINDSVMYWFSEWNLGDYNIFKMYNEYNVDVDLLDEKLLDERIVGFWSNGEYIYIELNNADLEEYYLDNVDEWDLQREEDIASYYYDKVRY